MKQRGMILPWCFAAMVALLGAQAAQAAETPAAGAVTVTIDKTEINNGGTIKVSGQAPAGKPVYLEIWADGHDVRASRFDADPDKETGIRPYIFYMTSEMPAYYKIIVPKDMQAKIDEEAKKKGSGAIQSC